MLACLLAKIVACSVISVKPLPLYSYMCIFYHRQRVKIKYYDAVYAETIVWDDLFPDSPFLIKGRFFS